METEYASKGVAGSGLGLGIAGTVLGLLNAHGGALGGLGGLRSTVTGAANDAVMLDIANKDAEIALLKAGQETNSKLVDVYSELRRQDKEQDAKISSLNTRVTAIETASPLREQIVLQRVDAVAQAATQGIAVNSAAIAALQSVVGGITKTVVPKDAVCPEPMARYNSWTAPTSPTVTTPAT